MNTNDLNALGEYWRRQTNCTGDAISDAIKAAQDHAYALGLARGREEAKARFEPRPPLTDERIDSLADRMPDGVAGFTKEWGWRQFARMVEQDHGIGPNSHNQM